MTGRSLNEVLELITNQVCFFLSILKLSLSALTQAGIVAPTAANVGKSPQYKQSVAGYDMKTIAYHCALLHDAGLIYDYKAQYAGDGLCFFGVGRLTWEGHELLDKIKSDTVWNKTKETIKSKGIPLVLDAVKEISSAIVTSMVKAAIQGI